MNNTERELVNVAMNEMERMGIVEVDEMKEIRDLSAAVAIGLDLIIGSESKNETLGRSIKLEDEIEKVTFNDPATVVFWKDGTKTVTKCRKGDVFNKETGLAMCIVRKLCNNRHYNSVFEKFCD